MIPGRCLGLLSLLFVTLLVPPLRAAAAPMHPAVSALVLIKASPGGRVSITVRHDALAFALNETPARISDEAMSDLLKAPPSDLQAALDDARARMGRGVLLAADAAPVPALVTEAPTAADVIAWKNSSPAPRLPVYMETVLTASLPQGAGRLSIRLPDVLGDIVVAIDRPGQETLYAPVLAGEGSPSFDVSMVWGAGGVTGPADPVGALGVGWLYLRAGFTHIVPGGPDHALFVLGLFLLSPRFKTVLWQITAFTIAHTITLSLTALNVFGVPGSIVEPTIALSIAFVGIENLLVSRVHPWRIAVAFIFGLVHGMGVATAFHQLGVPRGQLVTGLAGFTIGVEAGHLAVLAAALAVLGWWSSRAWYRTRIAVPGSLAISIIAIYWLVRRLA